MMAMCEGDERSAYRLYFHLQIVVNILNHVFSGAPGFAAPRNALVICGNDEVALAHRPAKGDECGKCRQQNEVVTVEGHHDEEVEEADES